jgi:hypothetical protein
MAELGIISAKGRNGTAELLKIIANEQDDHIPAAARWPIAKSSSLLPLLDGEDPGWGNRVTFQR